jgi:hypothetical protein
MSMLIGVQALSRKESEVLVPPPHADASDVVSSSFDGIEGLMTDGDTSIRLTEESMRVMYEDPGERDEKRRLMSMFESQADASVGGVRRKGDRKKAKGLARRSTRVAGF